MNNESSSPVLIELKYPLAIPSDPNFCYDVETYFPSSLKSSTKTETTNSISSSHIKSSPFETTIHHPAIIIPSKRTAELRRSLSSYLMHRPRVKNVYPVSDEEAVKGIDVKNERKLVLKIQNDDKNSIFNESIIQDLLSSSSDHEEPNFIRKSTFAFHTDYSHFNVDETLRKILPPSLPEIPSAFEIIGHIAHVNLREDCLPYKYIIGQVIIDKNKPTISLVVNKIGNVEGEFRTFPMEIIGSKSLISFSNRDSSKGNIMITQESSHLLEVQVKEEGCRFQLNFQHVYWNSRLQFEHKRVVQTIAGKKKQNSLSSSSKQSTNEKDKTTTKIVADVMAGVGPFAVPLTSKYSHIQVHANDLNPKSFEYLRKNAQVNRCEDRLIPYNMDGRAFIHHLIQLKIPFEHVIMNLPAIAIEFLDAFRGYDYTLHNLKKPLLHVHCFASKDEEEAEKEVYERCKKALGCGLDKNRDHVKIHVVRDIAPKKNMLCVSFYLPECVKELQKISLEKYKCKEKTETVEDCSESDSNEPVKKKMKQKE